MKKVSRRDLLADSARVLGGLVVVAAAGRALAQAEPASPPPAHPEPGANNPYTKSQPKTAEERLSKKGQHQGGYYSSGYGGYYGSGYAAPSPNQNH